MMRWFANSPGICTIRRHGYSTSGEISNPSMASSLGTSIGDHFDTSRLGFQNSAGERGANSHVPPRLTTAFRMPGIDEGIGMSAAGSPSELGEVSGDETELITVASARSSNFEARHVVQSDSMN